MLLITARVSLDSADIDEGCLCEHSVAAREQGLGVELAVVHVAAAVSRATPVAASTPFACSLPDILIAMSRDLVVKVPVLPASLAGSRNPLNRPFPRGGFETSARSIRRATALQGLA